MSPSTISDFLVIWCLRAWWALSHAHSVGPQQIMDDSHAGSMSQLRMLPQVQPPATYVLVATAVFDETHQQSASTSAAAAAKPLSEAVEATSTGSQAAAGSDGVMEDGILGNLTQSVFEQPLGKTHMIVFNSHVGGRELEHGRTILLPARLRPR